jgi:hypothetical protein
MRPRVRLAKEEGSRGEALEKRVVEVMGRTEERVRRRRRRGCGAAAAGSSIGGGGWSEVIEQARPEILRENAEEYALRVTFNERPYGALGGIARGNSIRCAVVCRRSRRSCRSWISSRM